MYLTSPTFSRSDPPTQGSSSRHPWSLAWPSVVLAVAGLALMFLPGKALAGPDEDAAIIKGCSDDIYRVRIVKLYDPEGKMGEVNVSVENVLRGDSQKTGRQLNLVWDRDYPKKNENWVVMVSPGKDGSIHVHPQIRYNISEEGVAGETKEGWIFGILK